MSLAACAELVRLGDPDRFRVAMAAPPEARARLFPLYAFNLEIARAPWVTREPLVAQMRLQFWRDVLAEIDDGRPARAHEVAGPLAEVMRGAGVSGEVLDAMVVARWADTEREPFATAQALGDYVGATAGTLMWASALALGARGEREPVLRALGRAAGLAAILVAAPELERRGWRVLPQTGPETETGPVTGPQMETETGPEIGLENLIAEARADLARARRVDFAPATPALRAAWRAESVLARAAASPAAIRTGGLEGSEFARRASFAWKALTGRW